MRKPDLTMMSTLKMGGRAEAAFFPREYRDLEILTGIMAEHGQEFLVMGRGSNILFRDGKRNLVILVWEKKEEPQVVEEKGGKVRVFADAGLGLPGFLRWCSRLGLSGLEGLTGIPGSLGGAVAMNAGSYGVEIKDALTRVMVWSPETGIMEKSRDGFEAGYRRFELKDAVGRFIILKAGLVLKQDDPSAVRSRMKHFYMMKKSTQPVLENTAGCVFKNPDGLETAGSLLEKAGFRGKARGRVCFSQKHSNFLVNMGGGSSRDALELISRAREKVQRIFGVDLQLEIKVV